MTRLRNSTASSPPYPGSYPGLLLCWGRLCGTAVPGEDRYPTSGAVHAGLRGWPEPSSVRLVLACRPTGRADSPLRSRAPVAGRTAAHVAVTVTPPSRRGGARARRGDAAGRDRYRRTRRVGGDAAPAPIR